ncbi:hypothetical protein [Streptococcus sp. S784/96/1]|uniref:hypothetical protein n=1 Tax=Streptococcus sp. S784/96/1 TaxID=2653499 RepID=UPI0013896DE8|nr:hypothetical protein [Streptococcus sp. S784/96/1]
MLRLYGEFLEKDVNYIEMIGYILNEIFIDLNRNYLSTLEIGKKIILQKAVFIRCLV